MPFLHLLILSVVQGLTEFLPVSSSGHLVLTHAALGNGVEDLCWSKNKVLDVAVHVGTLFSVLVYFRSDVAKLFNGLLKAGSLVSKDKTAEDSKLLLYIFISSVPVILAGLGLHFLEPSFLCMVEVTAWMTLVFGIILWHADQRPATRAVEDMGIKDAVLIGFAQILALVPGTSRSGITMTAARYTGFNRIEAARYSLLLGIIAISGAGALEGINLVRHHMDAIGMDALIGAALAFVTGWVSIKLMMAWLSKASFTPFAIYRVILGAGLLIYIYAF